MREAVQVRVDGQISDERAARLASAYDELADVLESVDLEDEPELADVVIDAMEATDEAYMLEAWETDERPPTDAALD